MKTITIEDSPKPLTTEEIARFDKLTNESHKAFENYRARRSEFESLYKELHSVGNEPAKRKLEVEFVEFVKSFKASMKEIDAELNTLKAKLKAWEEFSTNLRKHEEQIASLGDSPNGEVIEYISLADSRARSRIIRELSKPENYSLCGQNGKPDNAEKVLTRRELIEHLIKTDKFSRYRFAQSWDTFETINGTYIKKYKFNRTQYDYGRYLLVKWFGSIDTFKTLS